MTSTTPPPAPVEADAPHGDDERPARRFGTARALGLAIAAFLGGYLGLLALTEWTDIVREGLWSSYDPFGGQGAVGRFRLLLLAAVSLAALAGVLAVIGLAARRLAVAVLVVTVISLLCHVGYAVQVLDTTYRAGFLEPNRGWGPSDGLPFTVVVIALQVLVSLLCLVRGPRPVPAAAVASSTADPEDAPLVAGSGSDRDSGHAHDLSTTGADHDRGRDTGHDTDRAGHAAGVAQDEPVDQDVFLVIHGQEYGPYPTDRVRGFMVEGRIHPGTLVRIGDETKPASEVPAIYGR